MGEGGGGKGIHVEKRRGGRGRRWKRHGEKDNTGDHYKNAPKTDKMTKGGRNEGNPEPSHLVVTEINK